MPLIYPIITTVITVLGYSAFYLWKEYKKYKQNIRQPLSYDVQAQPFMRLIVGFTDQIRNLKTKEEINSFFEEKTEQAKPGFGPKFEHYLKNFNFTHFYDKRYARYVTPKIMALVKNKRLAEFRLSTIRSLRARWIQFLTDTTAGKGDSEQEKLKTSSNILKKLIYPFNLEISRITKEKNIIKAWALVLNDRDLKVEHLVRLEKQVERMLETKG